MKTKRQKRNGFYMNVSEEERRLIDDLQNNCAVNISQAFKIFLQNLKDKIKNEKVWDI